MVYLCKGSAQCDIQQSFIYSLNYNILIKNADSNYQDIYSGFVIANNEFKERINNENLGLQFKIGYSLSTNNILLINGEPHKEILSKQ